MFYYFLLYFHNQVSLEVNPIWKCLECWLNTLVYISPVITLTDLKKNILDIWQNHSKIKDMIKQYIWNMPEKMYIVKKGRK